MIDTNSIVENYFSLIKNLDDKAKLELISRISSSISEEQAVKQEQFLSCFGAFVSDETADEIINSIYKARHFTDKSIEL